MPIILALLVVFGCEDISLKTYLLQQKSSAPENVRRFTVRPNINGSIVVTWENPPELDLSVVEIACDQIGLSMDVSFESERAEIAVPLSSAYYLIRYRTRDRFGNISEGQALSVRASPLPFTEGAEFDGNDILIRITKNEVDELGRAYETREYAADLSIVEYVEMQYNEHGQLSATITHDSEGNVLSATELSFNSFGQIAGFVRTDSAGDVLLQFVMRYDVRGRFAAVESYREGTLNSLSVYSYTDAGDISRIDYYTEQLAPNGFFVRSYSVERVRVSEQRFDSNESLLWEAAYDDQSGAMLSQSDYNDGALISRHTFEYDDFGLRVRETVYGGDGILDSETELEYDDTGNLTRTIQRDNSGSITSYWIFQYD